MTTHSAGLLQPRVRFAVLSCALGWCLGVLAAPTAAAGAGAGTDRWVWPLAPRPSVVHGFDPPSQPWLAGHRGVDLAGVRGQRVLSAGTGEVTFAGRLAGIGIVVVRSGELRTTYQPVRAMVFVGERVTAGEGIGRLESSGGHCLPNACLHWGLLRGHTYLDPLSLVGAGPPRLLPLYAAAAPASLPGRPPPGVESGGLTSRSQPEAAGRGVLALAAGAAAGAGALLLVASGAHEHRRAPPTA